VTDADSFLAAIRAEPACDVRRLAFADWLDENATAEKHRATAEFLRLSCVPRRRAALPVAAGRWLCREWRRLVPALAGYAELHRVVPPWPELGEWLTVRRSGRWLRFRRYRRCAGSVRGGAVEYTTGAAVEFSRGFAGRVVCRDWRFADVVLPLLLADQPFVAPELTWWCVENVRYETVEGFPARRPLRARDGTDAIWATVYRARVGPCWEHLAAARALPPGSPYRGGGAVEYHPGAGNDAAARAKADVARALLARARLILAGQVTAGVDARGVAEAPAPVLEAPGGG
jgi:uncharacterized protein (TIGR02996 family)